MSGDEIERSAKARKRERNRRGYEKARASGDSVLLRLDEGGAAQLDAAANAAGLSRAAFCRLFLPPLMEACAPRLASIDAARGRTGEGLARFLGRAIDCAARFDGDGPPPDAADEFDKLFG